MTERNGHLAEINIPPPKSRCLARRKAWFENVYWTDKAVSREYGDKVTRGRLRLIMEQWEPRGGDLTRKDLDIPLVLEFDFKRRLFRPDTDWLADRTLEHRCRCIRMQDRIR